MGAILVVDDEEPYLHSIKRLLEKKYRPRTTITSLHPEDALRRLHAEPYAFDLVITDVAFPGSSYDGVRLVRDIASWKRARGYSTRPKAICITGKDDRSNLQTLRAVEDFGGRFIDKEEVADVIERGLPQNLYLAIDRALDSLREEDAGPLLRISYRAPDGGGVSTRSASRDRVLTAEVFNEGKSMCFMLDIPPTPLLYLNCMCRFKPHNSRGFTNADLEYLVSHDPSYQRRRRKSDGGSSQARKKAEPRTKQSVLNNLRRVRESLNHALGKVHWPEPIDKVFITTYYALDPSDGFATMDELVSPRNDANLLSDRLSLKGYYARYRLRARTESVVLSGF